MQHPHSLPVRVSRTARILSGDEFSDDAARRPLVGGRRRGDHRTEPARAPHRRTGGGDPRAQRHAARRGFHPHRSRGRPRLGRGARHPAGTSGRRATVRLDRRLAAGLAGWQGRGRAQPALHHGVPRRGVPAGRGLDAPRAGDLHDDSRAAVPAEPSRADTGTVLRRGRDPDRRPSFGADPRPRRERAVRPLPRAPGDAAIAVGRQPRQGTPPRVAAHAGARLPARTAPGTCGWRAGTGGALDPQHPAGVGRGAPHTRSGPGHAARFRRTGPGHAARFRRTGSRHTARRQRVGSGGNAGQTRARGRGHAGAGREAGQTRTRR